VNSGFALSLERVRELPIWRGMGGVGSKPRLLALRELRVNRRRLKDGARALGGTWEFLVGKNLYLSAGISEFTTMCQVRATVAGGIC